MVSEWKYGDYTVDNDESCESASFSADPNQAQKPKYRCVGSGHVCRGPACSVLMVEKMESWTLVWQSEQPAAGSESKCRVKR